MSRCENEIWTYFFEILKFYTYTYSAKLNIFNNRNESRKYVEMYLHLQYYDIYDYTNLKLQIVSNLIIIIYDQYGKTETHLIFVIIKADTQFWLKVLILELH